MISLTLWPEDQTSVPCPWCRTPAGQWCCIKGHPTRRRYHTHVARLRLVTRALLARLEARP